jgi:folate-binding protein YgfZ
MEYLEDFAIIKTTGKDAIKILHNISTNSIKEKDFSIIYSCLLTPNGRFMFDFLFIQSHQNYIVINKNVQNDFIKYISMYKMSADFSLENTSLKLLHSFTQMDGFMADPRNDKLGFYAIGEAGSVDKIKEYHKNRIQLKIADGFHDLTQKESIILDYGFDALNAISYTKGCYLGQELISRTKHTGVIRKKVCGFKSEICFEKGQDISQNEEKVGKVLGCCSGNYLALINFEKADFSKEFNVGNSTVEISQ